MSNDKLINKKITVEVSYLLPEKNEDGTIFRSGIRVPIEYIEKELKIDVSKEPVFDTKINDFITSQNYQIKLKGTYKSFYELGTLFITLAEYYQEDSNYHIHIDNIKNSINQENINLIIHVPT